MNKKENYEDCLKFIKNQLNIHLLNFQKELIKAYFENRIVSGGRGISDCLVKTKFSCRELSEGDLQQEHVDKAIEILNR